MVLDVDVVQLQDELSAADELLIFLASVGALGLEELPVEAAGCRDVADHDEWLRPDPRGHPVTLGARRRIYYAVVRSWFERVADAAFVAVTVTAGAVAALAAVLLRFS